MPSFGADAGWDPCFVGRPTVEAEKGSRKACGQGPDKTGHGYGLSWAAMLGFIRLTTSRQVMAHPVPVATAYGHVRAWLAQPYVAIVHPGDRHADILFGLLEALGTAGSLTTDAHLAALAIEHQAELHSTDADFARFSGLRWANPLA
jgi:uncharacterized protein